VQPNSLPKMENKQSYKLHNIALVESNFRRESFIDFNKLQTVTQVGISTPTPTIFNCLIVVSLDFKATVADEVQAQAFIKMVGEFKIPENPVLPVDEFLKTNAPAIIFPFLREHLASLTLKAGMQPFFVETINFTQLNNQPLEK
jgi:preprotein translocase subunit SecB